MHIFYHRKLLKVIAIKMQRAKGKIYLIKVNATSGGRCPLFICHKIYQKNKNFFLPPAIFTFILRLGIIEGTKRAVPIVTERRIMDDREIIEMLFERTESALEEISRKYSRLYMGIIMETVSDACDAEECANDVLLAVWNSIPPNRPNNLSAYICKLARRIGIDRFRYNTVGKRNGYAVALDELAECLPLEDPFGASAEQSKTIRSVLSEFIRGLDPETEILFVRRYIYLESVTSLAERFETDENRVAVKLCRARKKLKKLLEKEGVQI